jgi:hypothetical protein
MVLTVQTQQRNNNNHTLCDPPLQTCVLNNFWLLGKKIDYMGFGGWNVGERMDT